MSASERPAVEEPVSQQLLRLAGGRSPRLRWGERVPLEAQPGGLVIDASGLEFAEPTLALRLAASAAVHADAETPFAIRPPRDGTVRRYLGRAGLAAEMKLETSPAPSADILVPITRIRRPGQVEPVGEALQAALDDLPEQLADGSVPLMRAFSELCDNACTHGRSDHGTFLLAQRFGSSRLVLAVGDLGIGIPRHLAEARPDFDRLDAGKRIVKALDHGVSGTSGRKRGDGLAKIIEAIQEPQFADCELRIWSGTGRVFAGRAPETPRGRLVSATTPGTWTEVVLSGGKRDAGG